MAIVRCSRVSTWQKVLLSMVESKLCIFAYIIPLDVNNDVNHSNLVDKWNWDLSEDNDLGVSLVYTLLSS